MDYRIKQILKYTITMVIIFLIWFACVSANAQSVQVQRKGNTFVEVVDSGHKTTMIYIDKDGNKYPIYVSSKGRHYILKVSKKSGKVYKKYLKQVDEQLSNK
jgi:hypothetical protein